MNFCVEGVSLGHNLIREAVGLLEVKFELGEGLRQCRLGPSPGPSHVEKA